ncbi:MAG: sulfatase [Candidatus Hydrogenedentes bacterium]|nr:sulfatase [Candidatus Hydrogenedentota bacterium]
MTTSGCLNREGASIPTGRREFLQRALALSGALSVLYGTGVHAAELPPNFVFILSDDQGWTSSSVSMDDTRADARSDYYLTPNLERLAAQGVRFTQGYAPAALCCPTRRSLQYGQTPARQGDARFAADYRRGNDRLTIPRMLKGVDSRYAAAHFGKWDLRSELLPEHLGYDESDGDTGNSNGNEGSDFGKEAKWTRHKELDDPKHIFSLTDRANAFMERQVRAGRPFYLQVSHYAVHVDVQARAETLKSTEARPLGKVHRAPAFAAMVEDLDTGVGKLLDKLDALGIAGSTWVIYMADNGGVPFVPPDTKKHLADPASLDEVGRNSPLRAGKWTLFEGGIRVPFIVRGPGVKAGSLCHTPVVGWDLLPTIADLGGYRDRLPDDIDGGSFGSVILNGGDGAVRRSSDSLVFHRYADTYPHSAIRRGDYKLIKFWKPERLLLFNVREDIGETRDLAGAMPDKVQELHDGLMTYLKSVDAEVL